MLQQEDKIKGIEHIAYEIYQMLKCQEMLDKINSNRNSSEDYFHYNLYLEGMLLHLRALADFFQNGPGPNDKRDPRIDAHCDIYSEDYGYTRVTINFHPATKKRLDREVAHLTYHRTKADYANKDWHSSETTDPIKSHCKQFLELVAKDFPDSVKFDSQYYKDKLLTDTAAYCIEQTKIMLNVA